MRKRGIVNRKSKKQMKGVRHLIHLRHIRHKHRGLYQLGAVSL